MFIGQQPKQQILEDYAHYVNPGRVAVFKQMGLDFVPGRREGVWLWDVDGSRKLLNCRCSGGVFNLGHRPPRVVAALKAALDKASGVSEINAMLFEAGFESMSPYI